MNYVLHYMHCRRIEYVRPLMDSCISNNIIIIIIIQFSLSCSEESQVRNSHGSPKECSTISSVFRYCFKVGKFESSVIKCRGRLFQTVGAEWRKARSANTDLTRLTCSRPWPSDRSWRVEARDRIRSCR